MCGEKSVGDDCRIAREDAMIGEGEENAEIRGNRAEIEEDREGNTMSRGLEAKEGILRI